MYEVYLELYASVDNDAGMFTMRGHFQKLPDKFFYAGS